jgi:hypothetical protein
MSVLKPRNRLVNFRLSEEEFQGLKAACETSGARSLSDFARSAVLSSMERVGEGESFRGEVTLGPLSRLGRTVETLEVRVEQILSMLSAETGSRSSRPESPAS